MIRALEKKADERNSLENEILISYLRGHDAFRKFPTSLILKLSSTCSLLQLKSSEMYEMSDTSLYIVVLGTAYSLRQGLLRDCLRTEFDSSTEEGYKFKSDIQTPQTLPNHELVDPGETSTWVKQSIYPITDCKIMTISKATLRQCVIEDVSFMKNVPLLKHFPKAEFAKVY